MKSHQIDSAAAWLKATLGPKTKLAILQNGVEHRAHVAPYVGPGNSVVPVVVMLPAERTKLGEITLHGSASLTVAADEAEREFVELFAGIFVRANADIDFISREWEKFGSMRPAARSLSSPAAPMRWRRRVNLRISRRASSRNA